MNYSILRGEKELRSANNTLAQVQEVMQPMQQVMNDAASILDSETSFETVDLGHARKELQKVNVSMIFEFHPRSNLKALSNLLAISITNSSGDSFQFR